MPWSKLIDMEMSDDAQLDAVCPIPMAERARYPYGLKICLCDEELEKLGLDPAEAEEGDLMHMVCFAVVTSVSSDATKGGKRWRVELQIEKIQLENEMTETSK